MDAELHLTLSVSRLQEASVRLWEDRVQDQVDDLGQ